MKIRMKVYNAWPSDGTTWYVWDGRVYRIETYDIPRTWEELIKWHRVPFVYY